VVRSLQHEGKTHYRLLHNQTCPLVAIAVTENKPTVAYIQDCLCFCITLRMNAHEVLITNHLVSLYLYTAV
jgi:hypothetical protein